MALEAALEAVLQGKAECPAGVNSDLFDMYKQQQRYQQRAQAPPPTMSLAALPGANTTISDIAASITSCKRAVALTTVAPVRSVTLVGLPNEMEHLAQRHVKVPQPIGDAVDLPRKDGRVPIVVGDSGSGKTVAMLRFVNTANEYVALYLLSDQVFGTEDFTTHAPRPLASASKFSSVRSRALIAVFL
jgi:ABC-type glutathione transport system ATPase component